MKKRLCAPGSDLQGSGWVETLEGLPGMELQHFYRTNGFLAEVRPIFHHRDDTTIGRIVAGFLTLRLELYLQRRLDLKEV